MVVPLLVITPILAGSRKSPSEAVMNSLVQITMALSTIGLFSKFLLNSILDLIASCVLQEVTIGSIPGIIMSMSFLTEGLRSSNTLEAFSSRMLIVEIKHCHYVEVEASPFCGILVGLSFFTVEFEVDLKMIAAQPAMIASTVADILAIKVIITTGVCRMFDLPMSIAQRV